jgi:hypothetical protein
MAFSIFGIAATIQDAQIRSNEACPAEMLFTRYAGA